jgi:hypothetical protein
LHSLRIQIDGELVSGASGSTISTGNTGSQADGGGVALNGDNTNNRGGVAFNGSNTHPGWLTVFQHAWKVIPVTHAKTFLKGKSTPVVIHGVWELQALVMTI